ncbi:MAG: TatD family hydrolase [Mycoplasma sp.]
MPIFDTHVHFSDEPLCSDFNDLIKVYREKNIWINIIGTNISDSLKSSQLCNEYENAFASIGIHPTETYNLNADETINTLREIYQKNPKKIVAIGECGLDYHYPDTNKEIQKKFFHEHIKLAIDLDLPLMLHIRDAHDDAIEILNQYPNKKDIIIHCFTDSIIYAKQYEAKGYYISFPGVITFKKANELREVAKEININQILTETDGPWLSPEPKRGSVNESQNLTYINQKIADIKNMQIEELEKILFSNASRVLKLY